MGNVCVHGEPKFSERQSRVFTYLIRAKNTACSYLYASQTRGCPSKNSCALCSDLAGEPLCLNKGDGVCSYTRFLGPLFLSDPGTMPTNSAGTTSTTTTLGYKNLSSYNHVYTPVASPATSAEAGYRKLVHQDIEETGRDNIWLRDEINRVLVQNELLRHRFRYLAFEDERRRQFEMERRVQEEEQRRLFEIEQRRREDAELERRRQEEDERRREEERRRLYEIEQNRRLEEERLRRLEEERRRREEEERRRREEEAERRRRQQEEEERRRNEKPVPKPPPRYRGKVPAIGDMLSVNVLKGEDLKRPGKLDKPDPYVMVGFDNQPPPYDHKTEVCKNTTDPVWDEVLNEMATPPYARGLAVEVYDKDHFSKDDFMGRGELDLRAEQNEMHAVELFDDDDHHVGRVYLRYHVRRGSAASSQAVPSGYSNLTFNVTEAKGLIDTDKFGKQDPYVTLHWGPDPAHFFKTSVEKGRCPCPSPLPREGKGKGKGSRQGKIGQGGRGRTQGAERWAPPPTEGEGPRGGQRKPIGQWAPSAADENNKPRRHANTPPHTHCLPPAPPPVPGVCLYLTHLGLCMCTCVSVFAICTLHADFAPFTAQLAPNSLAISPQLARN